MGRDVTAFFHRSHFTLRVKHEEKVKLEVPVQTSRDVKKMKPRATSRDSELANLLHLLDQQEQYPPFRSTKLS